MGQWTEGAKSLIARRTPSAKLAQFATECGTTVDALLALCEQAPPLEPFTLRVRPTLSPEATVVGGASPEEAFKAALAFHTDQWSNIYWTDERLACLDVDYHGMAADPRNARRVALRLRPRPFCWWL